MLRQGIIGTLLILTALPAVRGQGLSRSDQAALDSLFQHGVSAFARDRYEQAAGTFGELVRRAPTYVGLDAGSAYWWLGRSYAAIDSTERAQAAWRRGWEAFLRERLVEPLLADAFVRSTYGGRFPEDIHDAADAYVRLLETIDWPATGRHRELLETHVRELLPILPSDLVSRLELKAYLVGDAPASGAGEQLAIWWRGNDVAPASRRNERLEEHLARVARARNEYSYRGEFDARGIVYVRLGPPARTTSVNFLATAFRNEVIDRSLTAMASDFPDNELWVYEHIDKDALYIFFKQGAQWREGEVRDLVPTQLKTGMGPSSRGQSKSKAVVRTLELIYEYLSMHHVAFATRYQEVLAYGNMLDEQEKLDDLGPSPQSERQVEITGDRDLSQEVGDVLGRGMGSAPQAGLSGIASPTRPDLFAHRSLSTAHSDDQYMIARRDAILPRSYSNVFDPVDRVEMPTRAVRFLDEDGTTRTEVYWGVPPGALAPSRRTLRQLRREGLETQDYLLSETLVQKDARYVDQRIHHRRLSVPGIGGDTDAAIAPRTIVAIGDTSTYHLAAQWTMYPVVENREGRAEAVNRQVRTFLSRFDSLEALSNDPSTLEMSDLKPVVLVAADNAVLTPEAAAAAQGHPYPVLANDNQLLLYFEVYHLATDEQGEARFEVEYVVREHDEDEGGTRSLTSYRISGGTAREAVLVDLAEWRGAGAVDITLRIEEPATSRTVERTIEIGLED